MKRLRSCRPRCRRKLRLNRPSASTALWDKVCRQDVLAEAYRRCRANAGAPGVDGETFEGIEARGLEQWLGTLREELRAGTYRPQPLLRVWIPKSNGGQRPLGIPCIRDRVVQMAAVLVIGPIFEADLLPQQYGFRPGLDAKMAVRRVYLAHHAAWAAGGGGRGLARLLHLDPARAADAVPAGGGSPTGACSPVIKRWLTVPVVEARPARTERRTARRAGRSGGRRRAEWFRPCWRTCTSAASCWPGSSYGHQRPARCPRRQLCRRLRHLLPTRQRARRRCAAMRHLMARLGLAVNDAQDPARRAARGALRLPRLHDRSVPREGRPALPRHRAFQEGGQEPAHGGSTTRRRAAVEPGRSREGRSRRSTRSCAAGPATSTKGRSSRVYELVRGTPNGGVRRWLMRRSGRRGDGIPPVSRTSISTRHSASTAARATCDPPSAKA